MVRKVKALIVSLVLICALCTSAQAYSHTIYENGTLSSTYITYFKDILSGCNISDNYIAFRSGQNEYTLVVGKLQNNNGVISLVDDESAKQYRFYADSSNYNTNYRYEVKQIYIFDVALDDNIVYTDLGDYPELIGRGEYFETITAILIVIFMLCVVITRIFNGSTRRRS